MQRVVAAILTSPDKSRCLLSQRAGPDFPFFWCHPGGKVEGDEGNIPALLRELREEIGLYIPYNNFQLFDEAEFYPPICRLPTRLRTYLVPVPAGMKGGCYDGTVGLGWFTWEELYNLGPVTPGLERLKPKLLKEFEVQIPGVVIG